MTAAVDGELIEPDSPPAGTVDGAVDGLSVDGVSIDSRSIGAGQLFVPIVAERDGHDFIPAAVQNGAAAYLSAADRSEAVGNRPRGAATILVRDTGTALTAIGRAARERLEVPVVGITGSVGKTSVKDLTRAACGPLAWASAASFNNELGVPLTLANAPADTSVAIVEMGARGIGHIVELCAVARPTIGVVTRVALAHSELFGSIDAVATGKGELVQALPADGVAVLNADDDRVAAMADRTSARVLTYGVGGDVRIEGIQVDGSLRPSFTVRTDWGTAELTLGVRGSHMALNAGAALAAALAAGVGFDDAVTGVQSATLSRWRMEINTGQDGLLVINDAYNANPTSVRAALDGLRAVDATVRVAVLGAMAELGDEGPEEHVAIATEAARDGIRVVAVDAPAYGGDADHVSGRDEAFAALAELNGAGTAVLVKGSRVAGLEHLADQLLQRG
ncbi:MAG: UDP-N-acetylmuramoyl-tripeptide--D-alanyl-D-alanine ligase [Actinomycetota bacterium]